MPTLDDVFHFLDAHLSDALGDLVRYCAQPSVSAQPEGLEECGELTVKLIREAGLSALLLRAPGGPPVVYGMGAGIAPTTLLLYNHYDVQPADPLEEWQSPPFQPLVADGKVYGRGTADTKGNIVARLWALRAYQQVFGWLPVTVKFLIEGEEEVGSPHLEEFLHETEQRERFAADVCLWEGSYVDWNGRPDIRLGVKGILYVELEARTAERDMHSSWAPVVPNPAWRLLHALASLKDMDERILIPGFYDAVRPATSEELASLEFLPMDMEQTRVGFGIAGFLGNSTGVDYWRKLMLEPTCNICGIESGYTGAGAKTVLPASARAKLDFRLAPDQRPGDILRKLSDHLANQGFGDIEVRLIAAESPARSSMTAPFVALVKAAAVDAYGMPAGVYPSFPGTGPMSPIIELLGVTVADSGVGYSGSQIHAPNEHIRIEDFLKGMKHIAAIVHRLRQASAPRGG